MRRHLFVDTNQAVFFAVRAGRTALVTLGFSGATLITGLFFFAPHGKNTESEHEHRDPERRVAHLLGSGGLPLATKHLVVIVARVIGSCRRGHVRDVGNILSGRGGWLAIIRGALVGRIGHARPVVAWGRLRNGFVGRSAIHGSIRRMLWMSVLRRLRRGRRRQTVGTSVGGNVRRQLRELPVRGRRGIAVRRQRRLGGRRVTALVRIGSVKGRRVGTPGLLVESVRRRQGVGSLGRRSDSLD